MPPDSFQY